MIEGIVESGGPVGKRRGRSRFQHAVLEVVRKTNGKSDFAKCEIHFHIAQRNTLM